jgi:DNA-binding LytR/AlgR family response regulator
MNTVTALIVEDEPALAEALAEALRQAWPELALQAPAPDGDSAYTRVLATRPQLLFVDIRLPGRNGLELARDLQAAGYDGAIVFVTAYDQHALAAFDAGGIDYLLKPVEPARLARALERVRQRLASAPPWATRLEPLIERLLQKADAPRAAQAPGARLQWIRAKSGTQVRFIAIDEVLYFQADAKVVLVRTAEREAVISLTLKELLEQLDPDQFWQIHRSTIVRVAAIDNVKRVDAETLQVFVKGVDEPLPVSRPYFGLFKGM